MANKSHIANCQPQNFTLNRQRIRKQQENDRGVFGSTDALE